MTLEQLKGQITNRIKQIDEPKLLYAIDTLLSHMHEESGTEEQMMESKDPQLYGDAIDPASSEVSSHYGKKGSSDLAA